LPRRAIARICPDPFAARRPLCFGRSCAGQWQLLSNTARQPDSVMTIEALCTRHLSPTEDLLPFGSRQYLGEVSEIALPLICEVTSHEGTSLPSPVQDDHDQPLSKCSGIPRIYFWLFRDRRGLVQRAPVRR